MTTLRPHTQRHRLTVVGSGNWGSAIAKIVAENAKAHPELFEPEVLMWVFEEMITVPQSSKSYDSQSSYSTEKHKLTDIINHYHENVKYLPNVSLPLNLRAVPDLKASVKDASILIFNLPHQFINKLCEDMKGHIRPYARGISCIKGVDVSADKISLFSDSIGEKLGIYCGALSGANIANEVALEKFSETTVAYDPPALDSRNPIPATTPLEGSNHDISQPKITDTDLEHDSIALPTNGMTRLTPLPDILPPLDHDIIRLIFHRPYFHVRVVSDVAGVSLGGALKNIIALAAGFVAGMDWGDNAKAAIMRVGLLEMVKFGKLFFPSVEPRQENGTLSSNITKPGVRGQTFLEESAGVADLITSCSGGRNYRCAKMAVERQVPVEVVEREELNGQILQGVGTAREVYGFLQKHGMEKEFPLLVATYLILQGKAKPQNLPDMIDTR